MFQTFASPSYPLRLETFNDSSSHFHVNCYSLSLSASCRLRVNIAKQNLNTVVSSIQSYLNRRQMRYPHIFLSPILRLLWATMVSKKSSPYSSGYTTHLGTSTNVPQCCDIIGGFAYFKLFEQGTGSYKYPQLVAHRNVVCGYLCSSSQDRPTLYLSDNQLHLPKTIFLSQTQVFVSEDDLILLKLKYLIKINFMKSPST